MENFFDIFSLFYRKKRQKTNGLLHLATTREQKADCSFFARRCLMLFADKTAKPAVFSRQIKLDGAVAPVHLCPGNCPFVQSSCFYLCKGKAHLPAQTSELGRVTGRSHMLRIRCAHPFSEKARNPFAAKLDPRRLPPSKVGNRPSAHFRFPLVLRHHLAADGLCVASVRCGKRNAQQTRGLLCDRLKITVRLQDCGKRGARQHKRAVRRFNDTKRVQHCLRRFRVCGSAKDGFRCRKAFCRCVQCRREAGEALRERAAAGFFGVFCIRGGVFRQFQRLAARRKSRLRITQK